MKYSEMQQELKELRELVSFLEKSGASRLVKDVRAMLEKRRAG